MSHRLKFRSQFKLFTQIRILITLRIDSIVSIDSNITDIIRSLMHSRKSVGPRSLRNSSINWIFLWRLAIQNYSKSSITQKRENKTKYLTWNSIRLKFVKTSMPNPVESLGYIKCYSSSSPRPVKCPSNSIRYNYKKIWSWLRRPKTILNSEKWQQFSRWSIILLFTSFSNNLPTERRLTDSTFLNTGTTDETLENKTPSNTYWRVQLVCEKVQAHSSLELPLEFNQNQGSLWLV